MTDNAATIAKLDELLAAIRKYPDPRRATAEWKQVYKLLGTTDVVPGRVTGVVGMRDVAGLEQLIGEIRAPETVVEQERPDEDVCRRAMQAFRKRVAVTVLDDDSKLGRGPLSKGGGASKAITPPIEFPDEVWRELVRQGRLRDLGHGFYELVK